MAIQALPRTTRTAMLEGITANEIIVGAYTDKRGICPMLAAHRAGGRTNLISFAKAWDRFALGGARVCRPRPATARELLVLRTHLEASLLDEDAPAAELAAAISEHRRLVSQQKSLSQTPETSLREKPTTSPQPPRHRTPRPGDRDRSKELRSRPGWSWTRLVRRYDEYTSALEQVRAHERGSQADDRPQPVHG